MTTSECTIFPISPRLYDAVIFDLDGVIRTPSNHATAWQQPCDLIYESSIAFLRELRAANFKTAIVSSLRDCPAILKRAGIAGLLDVIVDGNEVEQRHLQAKPHPDILLVAAWHLGIDPTRAVVIEGTPAGVEAGRLGRFGCVIGADPGGQADALREQGADVLVSDLAHVVLGDAVSSQIADARTLPSALGRLEEIHSIVAGRRLVAFLDYDGTLTPLVLHPENAVLCDEMRSVLRDLASQCTVVIISGRSLHDLQARVGINEVFYAGSDGLEIAGPKDFNLKSQHGVELLPDLDRVERQLRSALDAIFGTVIERRRFTIAVRYRLVADDQIPKLAAAVDEIRSRYPELRKAHGKRVIELQPCIDWNRGKAVVCLLDVMTTETRDVVPLYIGDDLTDEDVFRMTRDRGIGIIVRERSRPTSARYALENPLEVQQFLRALTLPVWRAPLAHDKTNG